MQRINDPHANPNINCTFLRVLPDAPAREAAALEVLQQLASQFAPLMSAAALRVTSLEEEFAGRNWNGGEVVEIVLRSPSGVFYPHKMLCSVMAHELAHNREMNHGKNFRKIDKMYRQLVFSLIGRGFFGTGLWGQGRTLEGREVQRIDDLVMPAFVCAGTGSKRPPNRRSAKRGPRRANGSANVGTATGRQTAIARKPGGRVKRDGAFVGEGVQLSRDPNDSTFRLQATSKNAVTLRLEAAERRALQARFPAPLELESAPAPAPVNAPRENTPDREADEEEDRKERDAAWGQVYYSQEEGKSLRMCDWEGPETTAHDESDDEMEMLELDLGDWSGARADHQDLGSSKRLLDDAADRKPKRSNVRSTKPLASTRRLPSITISDSDDDVRAAGPSRST